MGIIALKCPQCGADVELDETREIGFCTFCGTKVMQDRVYLHVDNSNKLKNLYERARKSIEINDYEHASEYYKKILDENPNDWEAYFYTYLFEYTSFTNAQAASVALSIANTIPSAYDMAIRDCNVEEAIRRIALITTKTADRLLSIASAGAALLRKYEGGNTVTAQGKVTHDMYSKLRPTAQNTITKTLLAIEMIEEKILKIIDADNEIIFESVKDSVLKLRRSKYIIASMEFKNTSVTTERLYKTDAILEYAEKVKELDPSFEVPSFESVKSNDGGCYVATAVYGSYDCPEVWTLRRYRDNQLAKSWYGRLFVRTYYAISPTLVRWFGNTQWFKNMWKPKLDKMVDRLQKDGVENTPYQDRNW